MARKAANPIPLEQQLVCVRQVLEQLRQSKPFRGQEDLIRDTRRQLSILLEMHKRPPSDNAALN